MWTAVSWPWPHWRFIRSDLVAITSWLIVDVVLVWNYLQSAKAAFNLKRYPHIKIAATGFLSHLYFTCTRSSSCLLIALMEVTTREWCAAVLMNHFKCSYCKLGQIKNVVLAFYHRWICIIFKAATRSLCPLLWCDSHWTEILGKEFYVNIPKNFSLFIALFLSFCCFLENCQFSLHVFVSRLS